MDVGWGGVFPTITCEVAEEMAATALMVAPLGMEGWLEMEGGLGIESGLNWELGKVEWEWEV